MTDNFIKSLYDLTDKVEDPEEKRQKKLALDNCIAIFVTGSHLYGTNTPSSDYDYVGVYVDHPDYVLGTKSYDEANFSSNDDQTRNTSEDIDCKLYGLGKFFQMLKANNPNCLETLFIPEDKFVYKDAKYWNRIVENKDLFISLKLRHSFAGYAASQKHKLITKKKRYEELTGFKTVLEEGLKNGAKLIGELDLIEEHEHKKYHPETETVGVHKVKRMKTRYDFIKYKMTPEATDGIEVDNKRYNFGMSIKSIYDYVVREVNVYGHRIEYVKEFGMDLKFGSHLFRLFYECLEFLETGKLEFPIKQREFLKEIKEGKYDLDYLLAKSEEIDKKVEEYYKLYGHKLQHSPKQEDIHKLQINFRKDYWKEKGLL